MSKILTDEELEPPYDDNSKQPKTLSKTRRLHDGQVMYVAGRGPQPADLMVVAGAVEEEEMEEFQRSMYGVRVRQEPEYLRDATGNVFRELCLHAGINLDECYYTALCKWLLPRTKRNKPSVAVRRWGMPVLCDEIKRVSPKIILCLGKSVFDMLSTEKISFKDAHGCWTWSEEHQALLYLMQTPRLLLPKPEVHEMFRLDLVEVRRRLDLLNGVELHTIPERMEVIYNADQLRGWVNARLKDGCRLLSVDAEWHGQTHVDGLLRSLQFAWSDSDAIYIRFRDDQTNYAFDVDYREAGEILKPLCDLPDLRYVGHHFVADAVWMAHHLGLEIMGKCWTDTEFAQQVVDEHSELGLERGIAMRYTTLGRYDQDLVNWKRKNRKLCEKGYGFIPDDILVPYACLAWDSQVQLGDGSWRKIHELVQEKYTGDVMACVDGRIEPCAVTNWKKSKKEGQRWLRVVTPVTRRSGKNHSGPRFTPDHKILTSRGMVEVQKLKPGEDRIRTAYTGANAEQEQVILGSLMGDGGLTQRNSAGVSFRFSQSRPREDYATWKAHSLRSMVGDLRPSHREENGNRSSTISYDTGCHPYFALLRHNLGPSTDNKGHVNITESLLQKLNPIGLAVWWMDDGSLIGDTARFNRRSLSDEDARIMVEFFKSRYGDYVRHDVSSGIVLSCGSFWRFMDDIRPFIHPTCSYKHVDVVSEAPYDIPQFPGELVDLPVVDVVSADRPFGNRKMECFRYCLTVPKAGNFVTKLGVVSNCRDVIAVYRAVPQIRRQLRLQQTEEYYDRVFNPFVTDVFFSFCRDGLPMDMPLMEDLRELFQYSRGRLETRLREEIGREAATHVVKRGIRYGGVNRTVDLLNLTRNYTSGELDADAAWREAKKIVGAENIGKFKPVWDHFTHAPAFNLRSQDDMRRWLFDVCEFTPVKSTNQREKGMPSMAWEKVLELPEEKQKLYTPSTDKQTLDILAPQSAIVESLLDLNVVGNLCKGFLKNPDIVYDENGDEIVDENGLFKWVASDGRVHGQMSTTETGRPRSWQPNTLNWPSYVNERIVRAIGEVLREDQEKGVLPEAIHGRWHGKKVPSIRSIVKAPEGHVFTESDYKTAEIRGLALISRDPDLTRLMLETDPEFGILSDPDVDEDDALVRLKYVAEAQSGIPATNQDPRYIMHRRLGGEWVPVREDELLKDEKGNLIHPPYDLHWSLAERSYGKPRETMSKKVERAASKVANFCCPGNSQVLTCEDPEAGPSQITRLEEVSTRQLVWDGAGWVRHDGVIEQGYRGVLEYDGLQATPEHVAYAEGVGPIPLVDAALSGLRLVRSSPNQGDVANHHDVSRWGEKRQDLESRVRLLRSVFETIDDESSEGGVESALQLLASPAEVCRQGGSVGARQPLRVHGAEMPEGYARVLAELQRQGHRGSDDARGHGEVDSGEAYPPIRFVGKVRVYDILNAGPNHRFTCQGVLVSNSSAYGATPATLERKIEADTGHKPEEGTGQRLLDAIRARQPVATEFLEKCAQVPGGLGYMRAASGRVRHFVTHSAGSGVGWRQRNSVESAQGREARNFYMQESVASTAARAGKWILAACIKFGLKSRPLIILYDSVVTLGPVEERWICRLLHEIYMHRANVWPYEGRTLSYPIDNEFNYRWSTKPSDEERLQLQDQSWNPTPASLKWVEIYLSEMLRRYEEEVQ